MKVKLTLDDYQILIELLVMENERCAGYPRLRAMYGRVQEKLEIMESDMRDKERQKKLKKMGGCST
jgi:hypothetical protein